MNGVSNKILNDLAVISQPRSQTSYRTEGLQVLARIIARNLLGKRRDNTTMRKDRKVSDPQILEDCR